MDILTTEVYQSLSRFLLLDLSGLTRNESFGESLLTMFSNKKDLDLIEDRIRFVLNAMNKARKVKTDVKQNRLLFTSGTTSMDTNYGIKEKKIVPQTSTSRSLNSFLVKKVEEQQPMIQTNKEQQQSIKEEIIVKKEKVEDLIVYQDMPTLERPSSSISSFSISDRLKRLSAQKQINIDSLTQKQLYAIDIAMRNENLFLSGCAGTGKSYVLKLLLTLLPPSCTYATAMTGVAASHIGGCTLHSLMRIGIGIDSAEECVKKIRRDEETLRSLRTMKTLVVDEISMCDAQTVEKVSNILCELRMDNSRPFGGCQIIFVGDFMQILPVFSNGLVKEQGTRKRKHDEETGEVIGQDTRLAFESPLWKKTFPPSNQVRLDEILRQSDQTFIKLLNEIRKAKGFLSHSTVAQMHGFKRPLTLPPGIAPTILHTHKQSVQEENERRLSELNGEEVRLNAIDEVRVSWFPAEDIAKYVNAAEVLRLKVGAQVMLIKNTSYGYNGLVGIVTTIQTDRIGVRFVNGKTADVKREMFDVIGTSRRTLASRQQFPLAHAWAFTIYKAQGFTLDYVRLHLSKCFGPNQVYSAMTRVRSPEGLQIVDFEEKRIYADKRALAFDAELERQMKQI